MPEHQVKIEAIAWRSLDKYCKENPKPRLSPRMRHRCKIWLISYVNDNLSIRSLTGREVIEISGSSADRMIDYAYRTIDQ